ncbi:MAG: lasso peptide biosynthesis B2 protein [candidate division NC10 bacterium]|nr:lasso peptide biosynthesis B2 protein [candidate division NC10 bacterium]
MKSTIRRVHKVLQLSPGERAVLVQAWGFFLLVELALRILPFTRLLSLSNKVFLNRKGEAALGLVPSVPRLAWLVEVAGRYTPVTATCLKKALVLSWLLGRRGTQTGVRIGVAREKGRLKAHAWLDLDGQVIIGHQELERYETLLRA